MNANPTPQQAADLLNQVDANESQARSGEAWPLVTLLFVLSAGLSVGLVAIGLIADNTTQLVIAGAGLSWLIPGFVLYLVKALSWSRRSTVLLFIWLAVILVSGAAGVMADSFAPSGPGPFIAAGFLWVAAPIFSLLALRR